MPTRIAIIGDLHYEKYQEKVFSRYRRQIKDLNPEYLCNLGDLGGYSHSGSTESFLESKRYFQGFRIPYYTLLGNHDLEGDEFAEDREAIGSWCDVFAREKPYYSVEVGSSVWIFLSSTGYRSNRGSSHEVYVGSEQKKWLKRTLEKCGKKSAFIFSHCPIFGSGVKILQNLHLRVPNAYINHSQSPEDFVKIVDRFPCVKLWFSAHNHLGQYYPDSTTRRGECTFVHTGVMGRISRDGYRHSRILDYTRNGFKLYTLDHEKNELILDLKRDYKKEIWERQVMPDTPEEIRYYSPPPFPEEEEMTLHKSRFLVHNNMVVEYDMKWREARGIVVDNLRGGNVAIIDGKLIYNRPDRPTREIYRQPNGFYSRIFFRNPYGRFRPLPQT